MTDGVPPSDYPRTLRDLHPESRRLCLRVRADIARLGLVPPLEPQARVLVAFSGGPDSVALALIVRCLGLVPVIAHLDHAIRPESAAETAFVQAFARSSGSECLCERADVPALAATRKIGLEDAGRRARHVFLEHVREERGIDWIATGHHLDDLCEDVILRLVRGAGWPALGGMKAVLPKEHLFRPLLRERKHDLKAFLVREGISFLTDPSNADLRFRRNRVRHRITPLLHAENPSFADTIVRLHTLATIDDVYWQEMLAVPLAALEQEAEGLFLPRTVLYGLPLAARLRVYRALVQAGDHGHGQGQATVTALLALDRALGADMRQGTGKVIELPGNRLARIRHDGVLVVNGLHRFPILMQ